MNIENQFDIANRYYLRKAYNKAFKIFYFLAKKGHGQSRYQVGKMYFYAEGVEKNHSLGFKWYQEAAMSGHLDGQYRTGWCYRRGLGVSSNYKKAIIWLDKAAKSEHRGALEELSWLYFTGGDVPVSHKKSFEYTKRAFQANSLWAANQLGIFYYQGLAVKQDYQQARSFFEQALESMRTDVRGYALYNLSSLYFQGLGVVKNYNLALRYCYESAKLGNKSAISWLDTEKSVNERINREEKLFEAIRKKQRQKAIFLLNTIDDLNIYSDDFNTPLICAIQSSDIELVKYLVSKGADVNIKEHEHGYSPLHIAIKYERADILAYLIEKDGLVNVANYYGESLVHTAVISWEIKSLELLLQANVNVFAADKYGKTAYDYLVTDVDLAESERMIRNKLKKLLVKGSIAVPEYEATIYKWLK